MTSRFHLRHLFALYVLFFAWGVCSTASGAESSTYPTRPIRLLVGPPIATAGLRPDDRERLRDEVRAAMVALQSKAR